MNLNEIVTGIRVVNVGDEILILNKPVGEVAEEAEILYSIKLEELLKRGVPSKATIEMRINQELKEMGIDVTYMDERWTVLSQKINKFVINYPELKDVDLLNKPQIFNELVQKISEQFSQEETEELAQAALITKVRAERHSQTAESFAYIYKTKFLLTKCVLDSKKNNRFKTLEELSNIQDQSFLLLLIEEWDKFIQDIPSDQVTKLPTLGKE